MKDILYPFIRTDHFNQRCWERYVNTHLLNQILRDVGIQNCDYAIVISANWLQNAARNGCPVSPNVSKHLLVIVLSGVRLITIYNCEKPESHRFDFNFIITVTL